MEIGFHFVNFDVPGGVQALPATLAAAAQAAEQAGASWFTMADHFFQMDNLWPAEAPMLEIYTCLGYLAGQTRADQAGGDGQRRHLPLPGSVGQDGDHFGRVVGRTAGVRPRRSLV